MNDIPAVTADQRKLDQIKALADKVDGPLPSGMHPEKRTVFRLEMTLPERNLIADALTVLYGLECRPHSALQRLEWRTDFEAATAPDCVLLTKYGDICSGRWNGKTFCWWIRGGGSLYKDQLIGWLPRTAFPTQPVIAEQRQEKKS